MKKAVTLFLSGLFMVALISAVVSDRLACAQDSVEDFQTIEAIIDIKPNTLNLKRNGKFITVKIQLPEGYDIENIDTESIAVIEINGVPLDEPIYADWAVIDDEFTDTLIAKFSNQAVKDVLPIDTTFPTTVAISIGGIIDDDAGTQFEGTDQIRLKKPGRGKEKDKGEEANDDEGGGKGKGKGKDKDKEEGGKNDDDEGDESEDDLDDLEVE